jgi:hypothetical protein
MKVTWRLDSSHWLQDLTGEFDIDDMSTDEEIEAEVREEMWNNLSLTWECEEMELTEQELADRMSNALNEIGETTIKMVLAEREACAKGIEDMIKPGINSVAIAALEAAAKMVRNRPR